MRFNSQFPRLISKPIAFAAILAVLLGFRVDTVHADMLPSGPGDCNPGFDARTNVTWYGDSWGDYVDNPGYGYLDWETYFGMHRPDVDWRIQNLAIGGWTTGDVYSQIVDCAGSPEFRNQYKTASNVVLEIGGNDYVAHIPAMLWAPWMYPRIQQRVLNNTEAILVSLKHPRRHKNVLMVGHIPLPATSPTLGKLGDYFQSFAVQPGANNLKTMKEVQEKKQGPYDEQLIDATLESQKRLLGTEFANDLNARIATALESIDPNGYLPFIDRLVSGSQCGTFAWYCAWVDLNASDLGWTSLSLAMLLHQGPLEEVARRNNAEFLPMYPYFIREVDCSLGACWVAKHLLYSEPLHKNYLGYFLYSYHVSNKLVELGWQNIMPTNGGLIDTPAIEIPISEEGTIAPVVVGPTLEELFLLCLLTGVCW